MPQVIQPGPVQDTAAATRNLSGRDPISSSEARLLGEARAERPILPADTLRRPFSTVMNKIALKRFQADISSEIWCTNRP